MKTEERFFGLRVIGDSTSSGTKELTPLLHQPLL
jgi:hypothetical protein